MTSLGISHSPALTCFTVANERAPLDLSPPLAQPRTRMTASNPRIDDHVTDPSASMERKTWIELVVQQLSMLRPGDSPAEVQALVARMWGSSGHLGPMTAAAILDRMLARRHCEGPFPGADRS